eukprot:365276-Chlamydomonas_euryale.AAC.13
MLTDRCSFRQSMQDVRRAAPRIPPTQVPTVSVSAFAFLTSEILQYTLENASSTRDLDERYGDSASEAARGGLAHVMFCLNPLTLPPSHLCQQVHAPSAYVTTIETVLVRHLQRSHRHSAAGAAELAVGPRAAQADRDLGRATVYSQVWARFGYCVDDFDTLCLTCGSTLKLLFPPVYARAPLLCLCHMYVFWCGCLRSWVWPCKGGAHSIGASLDVLESAHGPGCPCTVHDPACPCTVHDPVCPCTVHDPACPCTVHDPVYAGPAFLCTLYMFLPIDDACVVTGVGVCMLDGRGRMHACVHGQAEEQRIQQT